LIDNQDNDDRQPTGCGQGGVSIHSHSYDNINVATPLLVPISSYDLQPFTSDNDNDNVNRQCLAQAPERARRRARNLPRASQRCQSLPKFAIVIPLVILPVRDQAN